MQELVETTGAGAPAPFGQHAPDARLARIIRWTRAAPDSWLGRRFAFTLRRRALARLRDPVDAEALGARFRLFPSDNICEKRLLFTPQYFDPEERRILARHLAAAGPRFVFLDIGANVGAYSLFVAMQGHPGTTVIAVEPQPVVFERLCENIRQNPGSRVKAIACAVADRDGEVTLFLDRVNRGETGLRHVPLGQRGEGAVTVPARTLLTLVRDEGLERVDAIKIDVEGAEDLVLDPYLRTAPEALWPRLVIVEDARKRWQIDLDAPLRSRGYRQLVQTRLNLVYERAAVSD